MQGYIARLGGDEFILSFYSKEKEAYRKAAKEVINVFDKKIHFDDVNVKLGCSIGVTLFPSEKLKTLKNLIRSADSALYQAKASGRNTYFLFNK